jgi:hypothetical protein
MLQHDVEMRRGRRGITRWLIGVVALSLGHLACSGEEVIVKTADGISLSAADIDREPLRLMPGGALGLVHADAPSVFASAQGAHLLALAERILPIPKEAQFLPARDLKRVLVGLYSFSGVDFGGVAQGNFDVEAIEKTANGTHVTPLGTPLVTMEYAKRTLFVSGNVGVVILTSHTALFGNETGIRRMLDRLEQGQLNVACAKEIQELLERPSAPLAVGIDAATDPQVAALAKRAEFLNGMTLLRALGNFEAPGLNVAATLTYAEESAAAQAKTSIEMFGGLLQGLGFVHGLFGGQQPLQRLEVSQVKSSIQVVAAVDSSALATGVSWLEGPVEAATSRSRAGATGATTP